MILPGPVIPRPCEALGAILERCRNSPSYDKRSVPPRPRLKEPKADLRWPEQHDAFRIKHALSETDVQEGFSTFKEAACHLLNARQLQALWLHLVLLRRKKCIHWQSRLLVASVGASVRFLTLNLDVFPCVTPHMVYTILEHGRIYTANGLHLLAMQAVQRKEVEAFQLCSEEDSLLKDLAGNAFTGNILAAYILAAYCHM